MSSPSGRRRRVHSDAPRDLTDLNNNHTAASDGIAVTAATTATLPSPTTPTTSSRQRTKKRQSLLGLLLQCNNNKKDRKMIRHRGGNWTPRLILFALVSGCCFFIAIIALCYVKLACQEEVVLVAGSAAQSLMNGGTKEYPNPNPNNNIRGSERNPPEEGNTIQQQPSSDTVVSDDEATHQKIPRILIFTHYRDLLNTPLEDLADDEEKMLATNIHHSINIHQQQQQQEHQQSNGSGNSANKNGFQNDGSLINVQPILEGPTQIRFLTDEDCLESLQKVFPSLIPFFLNETHGMFKADICRGAALWETGGIYLDVDVGVRADLWYDLLPQVEFFTSLVHRQSKYPKHFFQAILGAAPQSPIIYKYLELFLDHYTHKDYVDGGPLGVILLRRAWNAVYDDELETPSTELYQEVLYNPKAFPDLYPPPTWGVRRACHFVVVARAHKEETVEFTIQPHSTSNNTSDGNVDANVRKYRIPLYSRVGGSRMCPIKGAGTATTNNATST